MKQVINALTNPDSPYYTTENLKETVAGVIKAYNELNPNSNINPDKVGLPKVDYSDGAEMFFNGVRPYTFAHNYNDPTNVFAYDFVSTFTTAAETAADDIEQIFDDVTEAADEWQNGGISPEQFASNLWETMVKFNANNGEGVTLDDIYTALVSDESGVQVYGYDSEYDGSVARGFSEAVADVLESFYGVDVQGYNDYGNAMARLQTRVDDMPDNISAAVRANMVGMRVQMDGETVGNIVSPYVSGNIAGMIVGG